MGNCSTNEEQIVIPQQASTLETHFVKPKASTFSIPSNIAQLRKPYKDYGVLSKLINLGYEIEQAPQMKEIKKLAKSSLYTDNTFKADKKSLGEKLMINNVQWKRPTQFLKDQPVLYEGQIQTFDLKQGKIQNSYFVSAFSALSHQKQIFNSIIREVLNGQEDVTQNGAYITWLFVDGNWRQIVIDDQFPTQFNQYIFSNHNKELWIWLIEKAYAKVFKSYENIQRGLMGPMLAALTGAPCQYVNINSKKLISPDQMWRFLRTNLQKNYIMSISTQCADRNQYFQRDSTFSYTVLDCQQVYILTTANKKLERIIKLQNPWGRYQWKGRWSEYSDVWSEELRHELDYEKADESILWINVQDMIKTFGQVCVCKYIRQYVNTSLKLKFNQELTNQLKGVYINVTNRTEGFISLIQKDHRHYLKNYKYSMARLILMQMDKEKGKSKAVIEQKMDCDYYTTIPIEINPGIYYLLIEMDWNCGFTREVVINMYADNSVNMVEDPNVPNAQSLFYELAVIDQENNKAIQVYTYPHDPNIKRVTGKFGGYVYTHYFNNSKENKYLSQVVNLQNCRNLILCGEKSQEQFAVKLKPGQEKLVKMKISNEGNGDYQFNPIINNLVVENYTTENLLELLRKRPTKVRQREIQNEKIEVYVKMFEYAGGVALLYENRMSKFCFIEEITFEIKNLELDNDTLEEDNKFHMQLEPHGEKLLSFLVIDSSKSYVFKTKVEYYLGNPQFKF